MKDSGQDLVIKPTPSASASGVGGYDFGFFFSVLPYFCVWVTAAGAKTRKPSTFFEIGFFWSWSGPLSQIAAPNIAVRTPRGCGRSFPAGQPHSKAWSPRLSLRLARI